MTSLNCIIILNLVAVIYNLYFYLLYQKLKICPTNRYQRSTFLGYLLYWSTCYPLAQYDHICDCLCFFLIYYWMRMSYLN